MSPLTQGLNYRSACDVIVKPVDMRSVCTDTNDDNVFICDSVAQLSALSYTDVIIKNAECGNDVVVTALVDSGAQLPVIKAEVVQNQNPEVYGRPKPPKFNFF